MRKLLVSFGVTAVFLTSFPLRSAEPSTPFQFESLNTLEEMSAYIREHFPLGTSRADIRRAFVAEGRATLKVNPYESGVEKYIYDINLCSYYIWRWNVSSDFDSNGKLLQAYVNGNIVFPGGTPKKTIPKVAEEGKKSSILRLQRPRPEASKGESSLGFILFDRDSDLKTANDRAAIGAGPSRAHPVDMGKLTTYTDVDPWRSIFDSDSTEQIVPYKGDCADADRQMKIRQASQPPKDRVSELQEKGYTSFAVTPIFSQLVSLAYPAEFRPAFENANAKSYIQESVPKGETVEKWSQMITLTGANGGAAGSQLSAQNFLQAMAAGIQRQCPTTFAAKGLGKMNISGYEGYAALLGCGTIASGEPRSEVLLIISAKGASDNYTIQWAERGAPMTQAPVFDEDKWKLRYRQLLPIKICNIVANEPAPYQSCIDQK